jgi:nucleoside-diphosphate-sugar epimerase
MKATKQEGIGRTVLVTGGAGFIGSHLVKVLLERGCTVRVADNLSRGSLDNLGAVLDEVSFHQIDLTNHSACMKVTAGIDSIFHLASPVGGIQFIKKQNVANLTPALIMHANMFEAARANDVERFLFASSACVYHDRSRGLNTFAENDAYPANPPTTYGWAKIAGERLAKAYYDDYGLKTSSVRIFNSYGENENLDPQWSHVIPSLIRKAILYPEEKFTIFGDGSQERAFLYVQDCVEGLTKIIDVINDGTAVNLGGNELVTIGGLAKNIIAISQKNVPITYDLKGPRGVDRYCANLELLKSTLRWTPETPLKTGLTETYQWIQRKLRTMSNARSILENGVPDSNPSKPREASAR